MLGKDSCGKVFLVKKDDDGSLYAMKIMGKKKAATLGCIESLSGNSCKSENHVLWENS